MQCLIDFINRGHWTAAKPDFYTLQTLKKGKET